jgi:hypothetical protein
MIFPGNANLPIGGFRSANQEIGVPGFTPSSSLQSSHTINLAFSRRMQLEFGFCPNVTRWCEFGSAGVPPAVLRCDASKKFLAGRRRYQTPLSNARRWATGLITRIVVRYQG